MKIWDYLKNAWDDINDDVDLYEQRHPVSDSFNPRYDPRLTAWSRMFLVHALGGAVGCAFARLFGLGLTGYILLAVVFAVIAGAYKSHNFDGIAWKYAFVKNIVLMLVWLAVILFLVIYCILERESSF